jgi:hypothetical protein
LYAKTKYTKHNANVYGVHPDEKVFKKSDSRYFSYPKSEINVSKCERNVCAIPEIEMIAETVKIIN